MTILIICVYALNRNTPAELYTPSIFQASDMELLNPNRNLIYILLNHPSMKHIYKLGKHMLEEHNC